MQGIINWFKESNRYKHFLYAIPCGFFLGTLFAVGLASGMEFKDYKYGKKWDWIDWFLTVLGGIIGGVIVDVIFNLIRYAQ